MTWHDAVLEAINRIWSRNGTPELTRERLIAEELEQIIADTGSQGATPHQTLSRVLQELRDEGILQFLNNGNYLLLNTSFNVEETDLSDDAIDLAIDHNLLRIGVVSVSDEQAQVRRRRGQSRIRELTLRSYGNLCALCDVVDSQLLVASHIARWADNIKGRGDLSNVVCLCRFHDALFETGYFSLSNDYKVLRKKDVQSHTVQTLLELTMSFRLPLSHPPDPGYLQEHRDRTYFTKY